MNNCQDNQDLNLKRNCWQNCYIIGPTGPTGPSGGATGPTGPTHTVKSVIKK